MAASQQNASNHAYRPVLTVAAAVPALAALVMLIMGRVRHTSNQNLALLFLANSVVILAVISRVYTTRLQDRIIRMEMRFRLERLGRSADFPNLTLPQLVALRFASDAELPGLIDRTLKESLEPKQIKLAVQDWQPDLHRT